MELVKNQEKIKKIKERAKALVEEMTLEEKVFQMVHTAPAIGRLHIKSWCCQGWGCNCIPTSDFYGSSI